MFVKVTAGTMALVVFSTSSLAEVTAEQPDELPVVQAAPSEASDPLCEYYSTDPNPEASARLAQKQAEHDFKLMLAERPDFGLVCVDEVSERIVTNNSIGVSYGIGIDLPTVTTEYNKLTQNITNYLKNPGPPQFNQDILKMCSVSRSDQIAKLPATDACRLAAKLMMETGLGSATLRIPGDTEKVSAYISGLRKPNQLSPVSNGWVIAGVGIAASIAIVAGQIYYERKKEREEQAERRNQIHNTELPAATAAREDSQSDIANISATIALFGPDASAAETEHSVNSAELRQRIESERPQTMKELQDTAEDVNEGNIEREKALQAEKTKLEDKLACNPNQESCGTTTPELEDKAIKEHLDDLDGRIAACYQDVLGVTQNPSQPGASVTTLGEAALPRCKVIIVENSCYRETGDYLGCQQEIGPDNWEEGLLSHEKKQFIQGDCANNESTPFCDATKEWVMTGGKVVSQSTRALCFGVTGNVDLIMGSTGTAVLAGDSGNSITTELDSIGPTGQGARDIINKVLVKYPCLQDDLEPVYKAVPIDPGKLFSRGFTLAMLKSAFLNMEHSYRCGISNAEFYIIKSNLQDELSIYINHSGNIVDAVIPDFLDWGDGIGVDILPMEIMGVNSQQMTPEMISGLGQSARNMFESANTTSPTSRPALGSKEYFEKNVCEKIQ